ncbi:hypothetical protein [Anatilimnocola floriformis]|uniref:hypothetical protein n=1 Tax=Anatilimnocola floriformis TaxID=2948575 RepID=UPI0020C2F1E1|nr:hypothetical protein [Anatilimnocola floriformis]
MNILRSAAVASFFAVGFAMVLGCGEVNSSNKKVKATGNSSARKVKSSRGTLSAEIIRSRLEPFQAATGFKTHEVHVDWKNTGKRPVRAIYADIKAFDVENKVVYSAPAYCIYATSSDEPGVASGATHVSPKGMGHKLPQHLGRPAARVTVVITKVDEKGY